jgi:predicted nucleic acid-binding protein
MNVVDSSGWLEYFAGGPNANFFAPAIEDLAQLLVSTINLYEVAKRIEQQYDKATAVDFLQAMRMGRIVSLDETIALQAADLSLHYKLPMADSMILATAHIYGATLWTQDAHFATIAGVQYVAKS